jgi:hypothetical protein
MKECIITDKKTLIKYISGLPDDVVIITPVCEPLKLFAASKKRPNLREDVALSFAPDMFKDPGDCMQLELINIIPVGWITAENAKRHLTDKSFPKVRLP